MLCAEGFTSRLRKNSVTGGLPSIISPLIVNLVTVPSHTCARIYETLVGLAYLGSKELHYVDREPVRVETLIVGEENAC